MARYELIDNKGDSRGEHDHWAHAALWAEMTGCNLYDNEQCTYLNCSGQEIELSFFEVGESLS